MPLRKAVAGNRHKGQRITFAPEDGSKQDLTGATITARIKTTSDSTVRSATGTFAVVDAVNGVFTWAYSAADVVAGTYTVMFTATYADTTTDATYEEPWIVAGAI